jgi:ketosteroid isomerase-like protein
MPNANIEALRRLYAEWEKGNMWALRDIADPDIEWEWSEGLATLSGGPRVYRGLEEIGRATLEWLSAWDFYWMTAEDFVEAGKRVVVPMTIHARTAGSDSVTRQQMAAVWVLRDGRAVSVRFYDQREEAMRAAGLDG